MAARRGRIVALEPFEFGPNFALIPKANAAYEEMMADDADFRAAIGVAHAIGERYRDLAAFVQYVEGFGVGVRLRRGLINRAQGDASAAACAISPTLGTDPIVAGSKAPCARQSSRTTW